jgi:TPR repeat protein
VVFIGEIGAFPADSYGPALAGVLCVVSLTSITLLIAPFARHAEAHALAQGSKAEGLRAWRRGDHAAAMHVLEPFAEDGDPQAQNAIGEMLISGKTEVPRSDSEATAWFRKAAFQGYARAQVNLGFVLEQTGRIAAKKEAARWYRCAALQGFAAGQHHLARHYETGEGLPRDMSQAVFWYTKAINQNYALSQVAFGLMRYAGIGVTRNPADALRLFRLASDQGLAEAQYYLGMMYAGIASTRQSIESR